MPFADARILANDLRRYPPKHVALSILVQWKAPPDAAEEMTPDDIREMRAALGGSRG